MTYKVGDRVRVLRIPGVSLRDDGDYTATITRIDDEGCSAKMDQRHATLHGGTHDAGMSWAFYWRDIEPDRVEVGTWPFDNGRQP